MIKKHSRMQGKATSLSLFQCFIGINKLHLQSFDQYYGLNLITSFVIFKLVMEGSEPTKVASCQK